MKLSIIPFRLIGGAVVILSFLAGVTQCSPPPPAPSHSGQEWRLAARHEQVSLLSAIGGSSEHPAWSPDGTLIAFQHTTDRFGGTDYLSPRHIYVIDSNGAGARRLTQESTSCEYPSWAPDSKRLVCSCKRSGDYDLYVVDVASGEAVQLTDHPGDEKYPAWSPDGKWIAFASPLETERIVMEATIDISPTIVVTLATASSIYLVASDGTQLTRLTAGPVDRMPTWSPDGQEIAYTSSQDGSLIAQVCVIDRAGANPTCYEGEKCIRLAWSPDGTQMACARQREIDLVEVDTQATTALLQAEHDSISGVSWSPDGRRLVFTAGPETMVANELYLFDLVQ